MANAATYSRYHTDTTSSLSSRLVMVLCDEDTEDEQGSSIHSSVLSTTSIGNKMETFPASRVDGDSSLTSVTNGHTVETVPTRFPSLLLQIQQTTNPTNPRGYILGLLIRDSSSSSSHLIDSLCSKYPSVEYTRADPWGSDIVQLSLKSATSDVDPLIKFAIELSRTGTQIRATQYWNIEIDSIDLSSLKNKGLSNLYLYKG